MVILDESSGLFNRISIGDWATMAIEEKAVMEALQIYLLRQLQQACLTW